jgi:glycosyltransferase involved in cell wall biosynthesis
MLSVVVPVYKNEQNLPRLLAALVDLSATFPEELEVVFVVDGSPDRSHEILAERLPDLPLRSQLLLLSRNFGSFCAIAAGLVKAQGERFAVLAADLQEPPELITEFSNILRADKADIVFGVRASRSDPWLSEFFSTAFWWVYRRFVVPAMPPGGVDIFGCTRPVRDQLISMSEVQTNLIALLFWMGYRRHFVPYHRRPRLEGMSAWTFAKKLRYCVDSIFNFTDLPLRLLLSTGMTGCIVAVVLGCVVLTYRLSTGVEVPGYTAIILSVMFFGGLTAFGLGIVGQYLWLTLQNTRSRPNYLIWKTQGHTPEAAETVVKAAAPSERSR